METKLHEVSRETDTNKSRVHSECAALEAHLGFWLRFVSNHVSQRLHQQRIERGVTVAEWVALRTPFGRPDSNHSLLIDALGMTKGAVSKVVSRLEEKGLAARRHPEGHGRDQLLALTSAGHSLIPEWAAMADANDEHFFGHLAPADRDHLMAAVQAVLRHRQLKDLPTTGGFGPEL